MSFYNNNIKCVEIQPVSYQQNYRVEFRLDEDKLYLSNLRLCNVGVFQPNGGEALNSLVGCLSSIKSISLLDGSETLDTIQNFNLYAGFRCYNRTNDENIGQNHYLKQNNMGFINNGSINQTGGVKVVSLRDDVDNEDNEDGTPKSWIALTDYFNFLEASEYIPTNVFKRFRIVIEYDTSVINVVPNGGNPVKTTTPFLVADFVDNDETVGRILSNWNGIDYRPYENSAVRLNAIEPTVGNPNPVQSQTFTINGYNDKSIERLLLIKEPLVSTSAKLGTLGSQGQYLEKVQYNINGANLLQGEGLTSRNMTLGMLYDLYGDCNNIAPNGYIAESGNYITATGYENRLEYSAVHIGDYVQNFQMRYSRSGQYDDAGGDQTTKQSNQALNLQLYAEVRKRLSVNNDGSYSINYV